MDAWTPKAETGAGYVQECYDASANWHSLSSFFESHGYYLYDFPSIRQGAIPQKSPPPAAAVGVGLDPYPYARRFTTKDGELAFPFIQCMRVWPARDSEGREVILRLVADSKESDELKVYQRLNTSEARRNPKNHTVPVLDWLNHEDFVFIVMPRWDIVALARPGVLFRKVSELFDVAETFFEGLEFLHEKRIAHRDIFETNIVMNALVDPDGYFFDLREPGEVRYAYIDYDASVLFPEDTDITKVVIPRLMGAQNCYMRVKEGLCNPFKDDVRALGYTLERSMRHIEGVVPEVGPFFERLVRGEEGDIPTASEALETLRGIRSKLSRDQLNHVPTGLFWYPDRVKYLNDYEGTRDALARFTKSTTSTVSSP